jgi:hypothetical protein
MRREPLTGNMGEDLDTACPAMDTSATRKPSKAPGRPGAKNAQSGRVGLRPRAL